MPKLVCKCGAEFEIATDRIGKLSGQQVKCKACGRMATVPEGKTKETPLNEPSAPQQATLTTRERIRSWINIHPRLKWGCVVAVIAIVFASVGLPVVWMLYDLSWASQVAQPQGENSKKKKVVADRKPAADQSLKLSAAELYERCSPAVVSLTSKSSDGRIIGTGTGFCINEKWVMNRYESHGSLKQVEAETGGWTAYILTNYHVIRSASSIDVSFSDGTHNIVSDVLTEDKVADVALLRVTYFHASKPGLTLPLSTNLPPIGTNVFAIGDPLGLERSLSTGIVSGVREHSDGESWLQTTTPISPGSSGGPLLTDVGKVVGMTTAIRVNGQNLNFAVSVSTIRRIMESPFKVRDVWKGRSVRDEERDVFLSAGTENIMKLVANDYGKMLFDANRAYEEKKYEDALKFASQALSNASLEKHYLAHLVIGKTRSQLAENYMRANWEENKTVDEIIDLYRLNDNAIAAESSLKKATQLKPDFASAHAWMANHFLLGHNWVEGLESAARLTTLVPYDWHGHSLRGQCLDRLGRDSDALEAFQKARELNPSNPETHYEIAGAYLALDKYSQSIEAYQSALKFGYIPVMCHYAIGNVLRRSGRYQEAIVEFQRAKSLGFSARHCDLEIERCRSLIK